MRGILRMLMMFGPMIFRQYQKHQRNKAQQQPTQSRDIQANKGQQPNTQQNNDRGEHT